MKKFLLCMAALLMLPVMAGANGPAKIELQENERILGHYTTDDVGTEGHSIRNSSGKVSVGVILGSDELDVFYGGYIKSFRVGLAESTPVTKVFLIPITAGGAYGTMVSWDCNISEVGWNTVVLPTPYQIEVTDGGQLMIGFEYEQTSTNKPLALVQQGDTYDTYWYKKAGQMYRWTTAGLSPYGNLCLQCVVEKDHYPEVMIKASALETLNFANLGDMLPFSFNVKNRNTSELQANALTFDVKIDGEKVLTVTNPEPIASNDVITIMDSIATDDLTTGNHVLSIENAVAGEEVLDYVYPLRVTFKVFNGVYPRQKHLIEQLTSTYCVYCPLGNSMLSILTASRDDIAWVGIHGELNGGMDPFMTDQGDSIMVYLTGDLTGGSISYPSGAFDRHTGWEGSSGLVNGLGYYEQYHEQIAGELSDFFDNIAQNEPSFASISIQPMVDADTREGSIVVSGELTDDFESLLGEDCKLTVYLTEDSLIARQTGSGVANYVHNGVFRCALGSARGVNLARTDEGYSNEFAVTVPADWNIYNLNVVAFISRPLVNGANGKYGDMYVINTESMRLVMPAEGIEEILVDGDAVPVEYYDITGRRMSTPVQGINIVKMSNGTTKKVFVK